MAFILLKIRSRENSTEYEAKFGINSSSGSGGIGAGAGTGLDITGTYEAPLFADDQQLRAQQSKITYATDKAAATAAAGEANV